MLSEFLRNLLILGIIALVMYAAFGKALKDVLGVYDALGIMPFFLILVLLAALPRRRRRR